MTQPIHTCEKTVPSGERCWFARIGNVTTFCHPFRSWQSIHRHPFLRPSDSSRVPPTHHCLLCSPHTDDC
jgi:hypothetical protein